MQIDTNLVEIIFTSLNFFGIGVAVYAIRNTFSAIRSAPRNSAAYIAARINRRNEGVKLFLKSAFASAGLISMFLPDSNQPASVARTILLMLLTTPTVVMIWGTFANEIDTKKILATANDNHATLKD